MCMKMFSIEMNCSEIMLSIEKSERTYLVLSQLYI